MDQSYQILSQNDVQRQGGMRDAFITVSTDGLYMGLRRVEMGFAEWINWIES